MTRVICLFCGSDAEWSDGELVCVECATTAQFGDSLKEYREQVRKYGCPKAKGRQYDQDCKER